MKRIYGSIPILAVLVLLFSVVFGLTDGFRVAQAVTPTVTVVKANPVPNLPGSPTTATNTTPVGFIETEWAKFETTVLVTVIDTDLAGTGGTLSDIDVSIEADENEDTAVFTVTEAAGDTGIFSFNLTITSTSTNIAGVSPYGVGSSGTIPNLQVDDEDEVIITISPGGAALDIDITLVTSVFVENDEPDIGGVSPEDEDVVDDENVDIVVEVQDSDSGIPTPEDLPDTDGNDEYVTTIILTSTVQCTDAELIDGALAVTDPTLVAGFLTALDCGSATNNLTIINPNDEDDFDDIDDGFEFDGSVFFSKNATSFFTVMVFDAAGNHEIFDGDDGDSARSLIEITVDEDEPELEVIRTGIAWDSADDEYDDGRDWIQVIFDDLTDLSPDSIDEDDFVVEGHTVRRVQWFDLDPEDVAGGPGTSSPTAAGPEDSDVRVNPTGSGSPTTAECTASVADATTVPTVAAGDVVACDGSAKGSTTFTTGSYDTDDIDILRPSKWGGSGSNDNIFFFIRNSVFIQLEDDLDPDEVPDVNIVPDGVDDEAGNDQTSTDDEAEDWIAPKLTIEEMTSPRQTVEDEIVAGEDDEIELIIRSDEDVDGDPDLLVTFVQAQVGCVVSGIIRSTGDSLSPAADDQCASSVTSSTGDDLNTNVDEIGTNRWRVTIDEPDDTGYYNIFLFAEDDESNFGDEGLHFTDLAITGDRFFETDGDVNTDDAVFFEGDLQLPDPRVLIAGEDARDDPEVEFRNPFFIEIDFTVPHRDDCSDAEIASDFQECQDEDGEYAEDNFDKVVVTSFELDGVDLTDLVSTTDDETFLVAIENIALGDHEIIINAVDQAGNDLEDDLELDFTTEARDPFERELQPGWNLLSIPLDPEDPAIETVFGSDISVTTIYTFDPTVPGGWLVAVRETPDDPWVGDLTEIRAARGYWLLSDAIVNLEVDIPRLSGGAAGGGTPIQPPIIDLFPGWNLVPIVDVTGEALDEDFFLDADEYFASADGEIARILGFDTITNEWESIPFDDDPTNSDSVGGDLDDLDLQFGRAYWIFVTEAVTLVPGGTLLEP